MPISCLCIHISVQSEGQCWSFCCKATRFRLIRRGRVLLLSGDHAPGSRMSVHTPTFFHVHAGHVLVQVLSGERNCVFCFHPFFPCHRPRGPHHALLTYPDNKHTKIAQTQTEHSCAFCPYPRDSGYPGSYHPGILLPSLSCRFSREMHM